jgi:hypothetical protein
MSNEPLKQFLAAIARDDYVEADKHFPNVVKTATNNVINKRKPAILDAINANASEVANKTLKDADKPGE